MKDLSVEKTLMEELAKTANISVSCERAGISRQTFYRWRDMNPKFRRKVNDAMRMGIEFMCDLAESKLMLNIKDRNQRAIEYYLNNHRESYMRPRPENFWSEIMEENKKLEGGVFFIDGKKRIEYRKVTGDRVAYDVLLKEGDPVFKDMVERYNSVVFKTKDFRKKPDSGGEKKI